MQVNVLEIFGNSAALSGMRRCSLLIAILASFSMPLSAKGRWVELNIGPFRVDTDGDMAGARQTLANLEQLRWILGGMLENKDLQATWPFRILIADGAPGNVLVPVCAWTVRGRGRPGSEPSFIEVAQLFLEANTPRLPAEVDSGVSRLFFEISARGSQVTWAKKPANPDVAWARMQLFATKPEYAGRFSVFLNNLRGGSLLSVAEANAFGKPSSALEQEIAGYFAAGAAPAVTTAARPLDPKRDFGEHSLDEALAGVFLGDALLTADRSRAEEAYKAAGNADLEALAQEGFALLAVAEKDDPQQYLEGAMAAGTKSAWVFAEAAESQNPAEASTLLMKGARVESALVAAAGEKLADFYPGRAPKRAIPAGGMPEESEVSGPLAATGGTAIAAGQGPAGAE